MTRTDELLWRTLDFFAAMPRQSQHLLKVRDYAVLIGRGEGADAETLEEMEAAAIVHDVGIKPALAKYGRCGGELQEELGPQEARALMNDWPEETVGRVCWLVGHHHTYDTFDGEQPGTRRLDYQALLEADFLVNLYEDDSKPEAVRAALENIFATETGKRLCRMIFGA